MSISGKKQEKQKNWNLASVDMGDFCKDLKKSDGVNCRLQVAGQDFTYM